MLSYKNLTLLTITVLGLAGTAQATTGVCLDKQPKQLEILLQKEEVWAEPSSGGWKSTGNLKGDATTVPPEVNGIALFTGPDALKNWKSFRANAEYTLKDENCIKSVFNNKSTWESVYYTPLINVIEGLTRRQQLHHLDFEKLSDYACSWLVYITGFIPGTYTKDLNPTQFKGFRAGCWSKDSAHKESVQQWSSELIKKIPPATFNDSLASNFIFNPMNEGAGQSVFSKMTPDQVKQYISDPNRCKKLDKKLLLSNPSKERVQFYTNACLLNVNKDMLKEKVADDIKQDMTNFLKNLSPEAFSTVPKDIDASVAALIPASLVKKFDSDDMPEFRCLTAPLKHLTPTALAVVGKECMAGWVTGNAATGDLILSKSIPKLPGDIFSAIPIGDGASFGKLLEEKNIPYFTAEHWKTFLENPANCGLIKYVDKTDNDPKFEWTRLPTLSAECLAHMTFDTRKAIFSSNVGINKFDEHVLATAGSDIASTDNLKAIAKNRIGLLKHLGKSVPIGEFHPCRQFSLEEYKNKDNKEIRQILDNSNSTCIRAISGLGDLEKEDASEDLFKGLPHAIFASMDVENLKAHKHLPSNFWSAMTPLVFEVLATPSNCAELDTALLAQINIEALTALHYECLAVLKGDLSSTQVGKVPKGVFEQVDSSTLPKLKNLQGATNEQLAALSVKVADPKKHAGTAFSDATITSLTPAQVGALNVGTVNALPDSAWKGFDPERFKTLRPEVLTKATCNKFKQLPKESLYEITAAQAVRLGEAVGKAEDSPRCVYTKDVLALVKDPQAAKILSGASQLVVSMALVAVSMVLGLWLA